MFFTGFILDQPLCDLPLRSLHHGPLGPRDTLVWMHGTPVLCLTEKGIRWIINVH